MLIRTLEIDIGKGIRKKTSCYNDGDTSNWIADWFCTDVIAFDYWKLSNLQGIKKVFNHEGLHTPEKRRSHNARVLL